jgi:PKD repeat protein
MHRLATRLRKHLHRRARGQSLVEFALVLPIIMLLTLTALDFGRVYLGYINLQNMARIAANFAANNPTAWTGAGNTPTQLAAKLKYQNEILGDAAATNCNLPVVAGKKTAPAPTFTDADADGTPEIGDTANVAITCTFGVITPVISNIVGGTINVSAASTFPVKTGMTVSAAPPGGGSAPNAAFSGNTVQAPSSISGTKDFSVTFRDTSGGSPTAWAWDFDGDLVVDATTQDVTHVFTQAGTFVVTMRASNAYGSTTQSQGVTVTTATNVDFTISQSPVTAPSAATFTSTSSAGGTNYTWSFGAGQGSASGAAMTTANHTYNTVGTYSVMLTVTYPTGDVSITKTVTVSSSLCVVPSLNGVKRHDAQAAWNASGFSGTVIDGPSAPSGNYTINAQSPVAGQNQPCSIGVTVNKL